MPGRSRVARHKNKKEYVFELSTSNDGSDKDNEKVQQEMVLRLIVETVLNTSITSLLKEDFEEEKNLPLPTRPRGYTGENIE